MAATTTKLTKNQVSEGLDTFAKWFPEEAASIEKHRDTIIRHIVEGTSPDVGSPLLVQTHAKVSAPPPAENLSLTPCAEAIGVFLADVIIFVLGLAGLRVPFSNRIVRALVRELGEERLRGFVEAIRNFNEALGKWEKAKALFAIIVEIYNVRGFVIVFKVLYDEMTWQDWLITSVKASALIILWVGTDGGIFIAQAVLGIMGAKALIKDGIEAAKVCSCT
ncbi:Hypothetical predicted protein [Paramuricea clavata]|uniref:Uncharacterized protein n=1 Tax=Paramuricea clavata TaxID=317549 RepID=A0A7D9HB88_PARCT|nr:Hypothetical predicted protein [Paramuricea clavata]